jgi:hypothetical protein
MCNEHASGHECQQTKANHFQQQFYVEWVQKLLVPAVHWTKMYKTYLMAKQKTAALPTIKQNNSNVIQ